MSPEVLGVQRHPTAPSAFGGPVYDGKAVDVWAIGVMLYTMLTKKYPFEVRRPGSANKDWPTGPYNVGALLVMLVPSACKTFFNRSLYRNRFLSFLISVDLLIILFV